LDNRNGDGKISRKYGEECKREGEIFHQLICSKVGKTNIQTNFFPEYVIVTRKDDNSRYQMEDIVDDFPTLQESFQLLTSQ